MGDCDTEFYCYSHPGLFTLQVSEEYPFFFPQHSTRSIEIPVLQGIDSYPIYKTFPFCSLSSCHEYIEFPSLNLDSLSKIKKHLLSHRSLYTYSFLQHSFYTLRYILTTCQLQPFSVTITMSATTFGDVYICCHCGNPNLSAIAPRCPVCGHEPGSCCTGGGVGQVDEMSNFGSDVWGMSHPFIFKSRTHMHHHSDASGMAYPVPVRAPRPSMAGWWECCEGHPNNPALCPERCSICGHYRCPNCHTYGQ